VVGWWCLRHKFGNCHCLPWSGLEWSPLSTDSPCRYGSEVVQLGYLGAFASFRSVCLVPSVRPSIQMEKLVTRWTDFHEIPYLRSFERLSSSSNSHLDRTCLINLHENQMLFCVCLAIYLSARNMFRTEVNGEKRNIQYISSICLPVFEIIKQQEYSGYIFRIFSIHHQLQPPEQNHSQERNKRNSICGILRSDGSITV
jgi:hypothetical protein